MQDVEKPGTNEKGEREQNESQSGKIRYKSLVYVEFRKLSSLVSVQELISVSCLSAEKIKEILRVFHDDISYAMCIWHGIIVYGEL
jgi:hypothetical protein